MLAIFSGLIFISAICYLIAEKKRKQHWMYYLKPGTMLLIIFMTISHWQETTLFTWVLIGLLFSVVGDIFLMLPSDRFLQGLISFFIAHLCYISAFTNEFTLFSFDWQFVLPIVFIGVGYFTFLYPRLKIAEGLPVQIGVLLYIAVICLMFILSFQVSSVFAIFGSFFFLISDGILAFNRFYLPFNNAHLFVMITYYFAQYLIALSVIL